MSEILNLTSVFGWRKKENTDHTYHGRLLRLLNCRCQPKDTKYCRHKIFQPQNVMDRCLKKIPLVCIIVLNIISSISGTNSSFKKVFFLLHHSKGHKCAPRLDYKQLQKSIVKSCYNYCTIATATALIFHKRAKQTFMMRIEIVLHPSEILVGCFAH